LPGFRVNGMHRLFWFGSRKSPARFWLIAVLCNLLAGLIALPGAADVAAGRDAFEKGDYKRAIIEWQNAADHGDAEAQFGLGNLYEIGAGDLKQDYKRAEYWYRNAAEQGNTEAQYRLVLIWGAGGDGFPPDLIEAYKWAVLATDSKGVWGSAAAEVKAQLDKVVSPREREAGKDKAVKWREDRQRKKEEPATTLATTPPATVAPPASAAAPAAATSPAAPLAKSTGGCPGWPFPTLPCTEQFPALPGAQTRPTAPAAPGRK
jgi:hypothetical protein